MYVFNAGRIKNSYPFIGDKFGGRDHTTIMHACDKINREIQINENLVEELSIIKNRIYES